MSMEYTYWKDKDFINDCLDVIGDYFYKKIEAFEIDDCQELENLGYKSTLFVMATKRYTEYKDEEALVFMKELKNYRDNINVYLKQVKQRNNLDEDRENY